MMVEDSIIDTFMTEYRLAPDRRPTAAPTRQPLVAAALCDRLSDGISMVYSFYDPEAAKRGLGTYMILDHIAYAKRLGVPYLYLGYWINGSPKMSYKRRFQPQEQLTGSGWTRVEGSPLSPETRPRPGKRDGTTLGVARLGRVACHDPIQSASAGSIGAAIPHPSRSFP